MHPAALLPFFSTLLGGFAALRLRHRLHAFMALAAGVVVATAVADLLPEAFELVGDGSAVAVGGAAIIGFVGFSLVEAFLHQASFEHVGTIGHAHHQASTQDAVETLVAGHGPATEPHVDHADDRADRHDDGDAAAAPSRPVRRHVLSVLPPLSLIIHSTLDGLAIGLGFQAGTELGLVVLLAVLAHDFADGMNVVTLALDAARGERVAVFLLVLDALAPPAGAALSLLITVPDGMLGLLLATFAGVFIAVGAGHLLPESQHRDPRRGPVMVALAGVGAVAVLGIRALAG